MNAHRKARKQTLAALTGVLAALLVAAAPVHAQERTTGTVLRDGVPETYVVQRGDTLWDISEHFLRDPWLWPDIWQVNPDIANPHLIYPGDIIRLIWVDGRPQLVLDRGPDRMSPAVREMPLDDAIPAIPLEAIRPFLAHPQIVGRDELEGAPYLLREVDGRLLSAQGNRVYARGFPEDPALEWSVVRQGQAYRDPETREILGYEAKYIADATLDRLGDPATVVLTSTYQEAMAGDRLIAAVEPLSADLYPRAPATEVEGRMIALVSDGIRVSQYQVVVLNRGRAHGVEAGVVLSVWRAGERIRDPNSRGWFRRSVQLPDERSGELIVFRANERLSYALVMRATREMDIGDVVRNP